MNLRVVGGVIAVVLVVGGFVLKDRFYDTVLSQDYSAEAVDAQLQAEDVELFRIVKAQFPDDYTALTTEIARAWQNGASSNELAAISQRAMARLRRSYADAILAAPDNRLTDIIVMSRDLHVDVLKREGRLACNRFAIGGPPALGAALGNYVALLDRQGSAVLEAIAEGRDGTDPVTPATAEDWDAARARALGEGATQAQMDALVDLDQENGDICAGLIGLLGALLVMDDSQARRLRASYVRDLARN